MKKRKDVVVMYGKGVYAFEFLTSALESPDEMFLESKKCGLWDEEFLESINPSLNILNKDKERTKK